MPSTLLWVSNLHIPGGRILGCNVYFLCCVSDEPDIIYVKIGVTQNVHARLRHIVTGCPLRPIKFGFIRVKSRKQAFKIESDLHKACKEWRQMGEWFKFKAADKTRFSDIRKAILEPLRSTAWPMKMVTLPVMPGVNHRLKKKRYFQAVLRENRGRAFKDFQLDSIA